MKQYWKRNNMRSVLYAALFFLSGINYSVYGQATSSITYDAGTTIEVQSGADECANNIIINGTFTGSGTICLGPLPVTLLSFESNVNKNNVKLIWVTDNEINNTGFDVERRVITQSGAEDWIKIAHVQGNGNTTWQSIYFYEDKNLQSAAYKYRIRQIDYNGNYEYFELANDVLIGKPGIFSVGQNYPNPSNPQSKIDYELPVSGAVTIKLYNLLGEEVTTIVNETKEAGYYTAEFDGSNLASGVYVYRIIAEGNGQKFTGTKKMILVK
jgi:hypothetical protein